jgi:hypothetical protein
MEKKMDQLEYVKSLGFDSIEEWEFGKWCEEAKELNLLTEFIHHPPSFQLSERVSIKMKKQLKTKIKEVDVFLLHPHKYTTDYSITINFMLWDKLDNMGDSKLVAFNYPGPFYIDVKGSFSLYNDAKQFAINRKWVMDKYKVYVNEVVPEEWFKKTFVPQAALVTWKTGKLRDKYLGRATKDTIAARL